MDCFKRWTYFIEIHFSEIHLLPEKWEKLASDGKYFE